MTWPSQNFLLYFPIKIQVIQRNINFYTISCSRRRDLVITKIMGAKVQKHPLESYVHINKMIHISYSKYFVYKILCNSKQQKPRLGNQKIMGKTAKQRSRVSYAHTNYINVLSCSKYYVYTIFVISCNRNRDLAIPKILEKRELQCH